MNNRKKIFFSSDWHCFHDKVLEYSKRPFSNVEEMHEVLIKRFNATVPEDGITYFLGDMGFCSADKLKTIIDRLNGTKVLILGNHDKTMNSMYNLGFDVVMNSGMLVVNNQVVTMSHCPLRGIRREDITGMRGVVDGENWHGESRETHKVFSIPSWGQFHLHGHVHSPNNGKSKKILGRQMDVGVDANNYTPVSISQIESWISKTLKEEK